MRTRMRSVIVFLFGAMVMSLLAACSGGGDSAPETKTGKFIDGPVSGVQYTGSHEGSTGGGERQGEYTYNVGSKVKFFIGNITLGEANAGVVVTPLNLVPNSTETTPGVLNIVRLLMSLGEVDANNDINISQETVVAAKAVPATTVSTLTEEGLATLVESVKPGAALATTEAATAHLAACLGNISKTFQGTYKGTMTPYSGWTIEMTVSAQGAVSGTILVNGGSPDSFTGSITGNDFVAEAQGGCKLIGTIDNTTGKITGDWIAPPGSTNLGGTFTTNKI